MVWGHNKEREVSILAPTVEAYNRISLILFKFLNNRSASSRQFSVCRRTQVLSRSHSYNEAAIAVLGRAGSTRTTSTARTVIHIWLQRKKQNFRLDKNSFFHTQSSLKATIFIGHALYFLPAFRFICRMVRLYSGFHYGISIQIILHIIITAFLLITYILFC